MDIEKLISLANYLDEIGLSAEADLIDGLITSTSDDDQNKEELQRQLLLRMARDTDSKVSPS